MGVARYIASKALPTTTSAGLQPEGTSSTTIPDVQKRLLGESPLKSTPTFFDPVSQKKNFLRHSSVVTQPLLDVHARVSTNILLISTTTLYHRGQGYRSTDAFEARTDPATEDGPANGSDVGGLVSDVGGLVPALNGPRTTLGSGDAGRHGVGDGHGNDNFPGTSTSILPGSPVISPLAGLLPGTPTSILPGIPVTSLLTGIPGTSTSVLPGFPTTFTTTGLFTTDATRTSENSQTPVTPTVAAGPITLTSSAQNWSTTSGSMPGGRSSKNQTKAIAGGVAGASVIIILGLIVFCILRRKRRNRASCSTSALEVSASSDILVGAMSHSGQLSPVPTPFLDFSLPRNNSPSKGTIPNYARSLPVQNNQGDVDKAVDPFQDPVPAARNLSNDDNQGQRARDALNHLQALTSQFEGEIQQLFIKAQSGQLSAEDRLKLEGIRHATGLTIQFDPRHDRFSIARSISSGSSSSSAPPSYCTNRT